jgi:hypothetical protein
MSDAPETRYTRSAAGTNLAYQMSGDGPHGLVFDGAGGGRSSMTMALNCEAYQPGTFLRGEARHSHKIGPRKGGLRSRTSLPRPLRSGIVRLSRGRCTTSVGPVATHTVQSGYHCLKKKNAWYSVRVSRLGLSGGGQTWPITPL